MNHKELDVWKESINLVAKVYSLTSSFPDDEKFGIVSQMRRAAISIPSNIAEGCARTSDKEILRFLDIVSGSLAELETQVIISKKLEFIGEDYELLEIDRIGQMLSGLKRYLKQKENPEEI